MISGKLGMGYSTDNIEAHLMIRGKLRMGFLLQERLDAGYCILLVLSLALRLRSAWPVMDSAFNVEAASVLKGILCMASFGRNVGKQYILQCWCGVALRPRSGWSVMDSMFNIQAAALIKG